MPLLSIRIGKTVSRWSGRISPRWAGCTILTRERGKTCLVKKAKGGWDEKNGEAEATCYLMVRQQRHSSKPWLAARYLTMDRPWLGLATIGLVLPASVHTNHHGGGLGGKKLEGRGKFFLRIILASKDAQDERPTLPLCHSAAAAGTNGWLLSIDPQQP